MLLAIVAPLIPQIARSDANMGGKTVDCYCTDSAGGRVELGEEICLYVDGRAFMARCEMSLNNPIWRDTGRGCLSSRRLPAHGPLTPAPDRRRGRKRL